MLYAHPLLQMAAWLLGLYALILAWPRVASLHLGRAGRFDRRRHQALGLATLGLVLLGFVGGAVMGRWYLHAWLSSGAHALGGLAALLLGLWGLGSGLWLAQKPKPRRLLPLLHGIGNLALLILALVQAYSGHGLLTSLAQGGK